MWCATMRKAYTIVMRPHEENSHTTQRYTAAVTGSVMGFSRILRSKGGTLDKGFAFEMQ